MKAAQITGYGGKEVVRVTVDADKPSAAPGQILVEAHAAAVNPFDLTVRDGRARSMTDLQFPATLGGDVAGTVAEIGEGVAGFSVGQAVYGQANALSGQGSFAEYVPVKAEQLAPKPRSLDFVPAAAIPLVGCSAYQALVDHMQLRSGQKILIHGGAGGIGSMAIQLARHLGAYIAVTAAAPDADFVKELGADEVIDYRTRDFSTIIKDYDVVYDTVGGETNRKSYGVLRAGGTLVSMLERPDEALAEKHGIKYVAQFTRTTTERLAELAKLVDAGALQVIIDKVFPLEDAAEALDYLQTAHARGKVLLNIKG